MLITVRILFAEELAKVALKKPGTVNWSSQFRITYDDPNGIQVRKVSFKKKILNDNTEVSSFDAT